MAINLLKIVLFIDASFDNFVDGSIPPSDGAAFISVELDEVREYAPHGFG